MRAKIISGFALVLMAVLATVSGVACNDNGPVIENSQQSNNTSSNNQNNNPTNNTGDDCGGRCFGTQVCFEGNCCEPLLCADVGDGCGEFDDQCGGTLNCSCNSGFVCDDANQKCICEARTCADVGAVCGEIDDGCGRMISCGTCTGDREVCGLREENKCDIECNADPCGLCDLGLYDCDTGTECNDLPDVERILDGQAPEEFDCNGAFIYVDSAAGSDGARGLPSDPVASIGKALELARGGSVSGIVVGGDGEYRESITMIPGVSIYGGYAGKSGDWKRDRGLKPTIQAEASMHGEDDRLVAVEANGISLETVLSGFEITTSDGTDGTDGPGMTVYGIYARNAPALRILDVTVEVGAGGAGGEGTAGMEGADGVDGMNGKDHDEGGTGGAGGSSTCNNFTTTGGSGGNGSSTATARQGNASTPNNTPGGAGAEPLSNAMPGTDAPLPDPPDARHGNAGTAGGREENGYWVIDGRGGDGQNGSGGIAGGGGGGGIPDGGVGPSGGGGGGSGGCGGTAGTGGWPGGSSFGIFVYNSAGIKLENTSVTSSDGGEGGDGGDGGRGGSGGEGGDGGGSGSGSSADPPRTLGARGGNGSEGEAGGAGGGGAGGDSYPAYCINSTVDYVGDSNRLTRGEGGAGGAGGSSRYTDDQGNNATSDAPVGDTGQSSNGNCGSP